MASKQILREVYLAKRLFLTAEEWEIRNKSVVLQLIDLIEKRESKNIHCFLPIRSKNEVDTFQVIDHFKDRNDVRFIIPKTEKEGQLSHYVLNDSCKIMTNKWGIPEPILGDLADIESIELVIVPLVVADKLGNRIGYGKGYYDRFIAQIPTTYTVGVSLLPLLDEILFVEENDVPLNSIVTP